MAAETDVLDVSEDVKDRCTQHGDQRTSQRSPQRDWHRQRQTQADLERARIVEQLNIEWWEGRHRTEEAHRRQECPRAGHQIDGPDHCSDHPRRQRITHQAILSAERWTGRGPYRAGPKRTSSVHRLDRPFTTSARLRPRSMGAIKPEAVHATPTTSALIEVEHLSRHLDQQGQRTLILDDVTFSVPQGSLFAINGPSGSGKSTVLNMLTGLDHPSSGRIIFGSHELSAKSEDALARRRGTNAGIGFQFFQLLPTLTARENVMLALELGGVLPRRAWDERARRCLELVGIDHLGNRLPTAMSGVQQQPVPIAPPLPNHPPPPPPPPPTL